MIVDWRRHCGREQWRLFRDSDTVTEIEWYWCDPEAKIFPLRTPFRDPIYSTDYPKTWKGLGQIPGSSFVRTNGINRCRYKGTCYTGTEDQWAYGLRLSDLANQPAPPPDCCRPCSCPPTVYLNTQSQGFPQCNFNVGGDLDAAPCLVCRFPDPPPSVLYAHVGGTLDGWCECFNVTALHYGSYDYVDSDLVPPAVVTGNAWAGIIPDCGTDEIRFIVFLSSSRIWHWQWGETGDVRFVGIDLRYACPCSGEMLPQLYNATGIGTCNAGEFGILTVVIDDHAPHSAAFDIVAHFSGGGIWEAPADENVRGEFSGGGEVAYYSAVSFSIEGDFSCGGNMSKQFNRVVSVDIEGDFSAGGSLDLNNIMAITIEGDFSCGGIFRP